MQSPIDIAASSVGVRVLSNVESFKSIVLPAATRVIMLFIKFATELPMAIPMTPQGTPARTPAMVMGLVNMVTLSWRPVAP